MAYYSGARRYALRRRKKLLTAVAFMVVAGVSYQVGVVTATGAGTGLSGTGVSVLDGMTEVAYQVVGAIYYVVTGILFLLFCEFTTTFCRDLTFALR